MADATELDLDAIRARLNAATPGPWHRDHDTLDLPQYGCTTQGDYGWVTGGPNYPRYDEDTPQAQADAEFIAHARTDVERLLAALDEARAEAAKWLSVSESTLEANKVLLKTIRRADREREAAESSLAAVRALADKWEVLASRMDPRSWSGIARQDCADEIRAALAPTPPDENPATTEGDRA